jgi:RNA polymerase sigma factor (sigma-70 family)
MLEAMRFAPQLRAVLDEFATDRLSVNEMIEETYERIARTPEADRIGILCVQSFVLETGRSVARSRQARGNGRMTLQQTRRIAERDRYCEFIPFLPEKRRGVISMFYAGKSAKQIAIELGISHETVTSHLKGARSELALRLAAKNCKENPGSRS